MSKRPVAGEEQPVLSVVIPTLGRQSLLETLESLRGLEEFPRLEVIVCGRIHDEEVLRRVAELCAKHGNLIHVPVEFETGDSSRKKNAGAEQARAPLVAFLDDDVIVGRHWVERIVSLFGEEDVGLVSGPGLIPPDTHGFARLAGLTLQSLAAGYVAGRYSGGRGEPRRIRWSQIIGCNMVYRASVLREIGGFDPAFWPGEEMIAAYRAQQKYRILFHPEAVVYHRPRSTLGGFWRQMWGYGATRIRLIRGGAPVEPSTLFPMGWVASLVALIPLAFVSWLAACFLALELILYLAADVAVTALKVADTRSAADAGILLTVPLMHLAYGLAQWYEVFFPNRDLGRQVKTSVQRS